MSCFRVLVTALCLLLPACGQPSASDPEPGPTTDDSTGGTDTTGDGDGDAPFPDPGPTTAEQLAEFYERNGGEGAFSDHYRAMIETMLFAEDEIAAGDLAAARSRIDALLAEYPWTSGAWDDTGGHGDLNVGLPIAYYGLRMLDVVASEPPATESGTLRLTAVVARCATVRRPLVGGGAETVELDVDPGILANDGRTLRESTHLIRRWIQSITGGAVVELVIHAQDECASVDYTDDGSVVVSYPDAAAMLRRVPADIAETTDLWWVVAPSGVPGDGSQFDRHFITGGMGLSDTGLPLFLSDDAWFTRKVAHLGSGDYTTAERRLYQPQWFQHEFMHHLFRSWPEFGLEASPHQWFDRSTWPEDFDGRNEPDYYAEAIAKRLSSAVPSLAEGLTAPRRVVLTDGAELVGEYRREPVENGWHQVEVAVDGGELRWSNAAGASWSLRVDGGRAYSEPSSPYGENEVVLMRLADGQLVLVFRQERFYRQ